MKKTLFFGLIAVTLAFTACSKDTDDILSENETPQPKGMILYATVDQPSAKQSVNSRATIDDSANTWHFAFSQKDEVRVVSSRDYRTYYTFTHDGTNFVSTDAKPTEREATWCAYFPSDKVDLTNQAGTMAGVANLYALAGKQESTTGADGLNIKMHACVSVLKINNYEGALDIRVKPCAGSFWITGMLASGNDEYFVPEIDVSFEPRSFFKTTEKGTYYVVVPAGQEFAIYNGDKHMYSTHGLTSGKYYELTVGTPTTPLPADALPGVFTISSLRKVHFSKGNLQAKYDGTNYTWGFAEHQYDFVGINAGNTTIDNQTSGSVVDLFGYSTSATYYGINTSHDNKDYAGDFVDWGTAVDDKGTWRTLSKDEWVYLCKTRSASTVNGVENARYARAVVNHVDGVILLPDDYVHPSGVKDIVNINKYDCLYWDNIFDESAWANMESAGAVFLPTAGNRYSSDVFDSDHIGYYWTSTPTSNVSLGHAYYVYFNSSIFVPNEFQDRLYGFSVRLITEFK